MQAMMAVIGQSEPWLGQHATLALAAPDELPPFRVVTFFMAADPLQAMTLVLLASAVLYGWGIRALRERGDAWGTGRTVAFLVGLALIASVTLSGLETYDTTLVSVHMVQHMVLTMLAPIFLALGAPATLALRTLPPAGRRVLLAVLHSWVAKIYTFPLVSFGIFVASPFALYFSGLYKISLQYAPVHALVHLHLIISGCVFFWPLIGLDPVPGRVPYPMRALLMFLSTPFHTVLGLTVMQSSELLGEDWYPSLHLSWADPFADQKLAGGILWAGGEFVSVAMLGALVVQWMRHSEREARRVDRALDRAEAADRAQALDGAEAGVTGGAAQGPAGDGPPVASALAPETTRPWWETSARTPADAPLAETDR